MKTVKYYLLVAAIIGFCLYSFANGVSRWIGADHPVLGRYEGLDAVTYAEEGK